MDMIGRIRRLHSRGKKSEREIARLTGLSRNTVAKWLHGEVDGPPKYRRGEMPSKLEAFEETIKQALKADARRPRHERRTARALYAEIKAAGYEGGYTRVTDFIRAWRQGEGAGVVARAFVPLSFELGEAFQFDWSEEGLVVGGIYYRLQVAHMKLCASRAFWEVAYPSIMHFTPTGASWLNMVERFFRDITDKRIRRDSFTSVPELELAIDLYVAQHNIEPKPFIWTASASDILAKVTRAKAALAAASR